MVTGAWSPRPAITKSFLHEFPSSSCCTELCYPPGGPLQRAGNLLKQPHSSWTQKAKFNEELYATECIPSGLVYNWRPRQHKWVMWFWVSHFIQLLSSGSPIFVLSTCKAQSDTISFGSPFSSSTYTTAWSSHPSCMSNLSFIPNLTRLNRALSANGWRTVLASHCARPSHIIINREYLEIT